MPDGFIRHRQSDATQYVFLEYVSSRITPVGQYKLVKKYADYFETDAWSSRRAGSPTVLLVCESESVLKAIRKQVAASDVGDEHFLIRLKDSSENILV